MNRTIFTLLISLFLTYGIHADHAERLNSVSASVTSEVFSGLLSDWTTEYNRIPFFVAALPNELSASVDVRESAKSEDYAEMFTRDCCDDFDGKPDKMTFTFLGGGCAADNNSQGDKSDCNGGVGTPASVTIVASEKDDGSGDQYFSGTVLLGETFTADANGEKLNNPFFIRLNSGQETIEIHTSCSAPVIPGERYGSLELLSWASEKGEVCGADDGGGPNGDGFDGQDCCDKVDGKPLELTFSYEGGGCAASNNSQGDKTECFGGVGSPASVTIVATENEDGSGDQYFSGTVQLGEFFTIDNNGDKLNSKFFVRINGGAEQQEIHASCSAPLIPGERFGSLRLISLFTDEGNFCGSDDPCVIAGGDGDSDGVCDDEDCVPDDPNFPAAPGSPCDDGDPNTTNDVVLSDGCSCEGTIPDPCVGQGGDTDMDGVCDNQDCAPLNPNIPTTPGTACNDGNPATTNDVIQADGCTCEGTFDPCVGQGGDTDQDGVCDNQDCAPLNPNIPATPGTPCNDGNPNTLNDVIQADGCTCAGGPIDPCINQGGDSDGDGVCDNQDCAPLNANLPTTPGTACDDGNPSTVNDVIQSDGCSCKGTPGTSPCDNISFAAVPGRIIVSGHTNAPIYQIQVFDANWSPVFQCLNNECEDPQNIQVPNGGMYHVLVKLYTSVWSPICSAQIKLTIPPGDPCLGQGGDSDQDGVCDNQDCAPFNPNIPTTPGTACNDGNPNTINDVIQADGCTCAGVPSDPCINQGGDTDGDGVCDNQDCAPFNPNIPTTPGTACNDGNPNTINDVIQADGCTCAGVPSDPCINQGGDTDGDGVCDNQDCAPFNPNIPTTPGTACNDGNPNTINDVIQADGCTCAGVPSDPCINQGGDTDGDGVCDNQDCAPFNPNLPTTPGTTCDDGNANTNNDVIQADGCSCKGTPVTTSPCDNISIVANAGNITISGVTSAPIYQIQIFNASWQTEFQCLNNGCSDPQVIPVPDGTYYVYVKLYTSGWKPECTVQETVIVPPGNPCVGQGGDTDGDGVCDNQDCAPFNPNLPTTPGTACNDGNPNTVNDVIQADGCSCAGVFDPCVGQGGDSDGDGVCDNQDCAPFNPNLPTTPGTVCNDGNPNTVNDVIQADGCSCAGVLNPCVGQGGDTDGDGVCDNQDCAPFNPNLPTTPGTACNDGNPNTVNDVIQADGCSCAGTPDTTPCDDVNIEISAGKITITGVTAAPVYQIQIFDANWNPLFQCLNNQCSNPQMYQVPAGMYQVLVKLYTSTWSPICTLQKKVTVPPGDPCVGQGGDSDGDGVCDNEDCAPLNPNFPKAPGTPCNDGNPNTVNDVILADGCSCAGTFDPCVGQGGDSDGDGVCDNQDCAPLNPNFPANPGTPCNDGNPNTVNDVILADGCSCAGTFDPCVGQGGDSDGDGVCDNQDCAPFDPNIPTTPGTPCNDGDPTTVNDVILADGCSCEGTFDPCAGQGGDTDGDGVCDNEDCAPNDPDLPTTPGTTCDDGDPNTFDDVILSDGCNCQGTPFNGSDCCDTFDGKPDKMTFRFEGGGCAEDNNSQGDKSDCIGGVGTPASVTIVASEKDDGSGDQYFSGTIQLGEVFTADAFGEKLNNPFFIRLNGSQETIEVHTSCSAPLIPGERYGSLRLISYESDKGEVCGPGGPGGSGNVDCCDDFDGKPDQMTFTFFGGGCAADNNSQGDKSDCNGGVGTPASVTIVASEKDDGSGDQYFSGTVQLGETFTVDANGEKLNNPFFIRINGGQETIEIHTSCSAPVIPGERYGSLELISWASDRGEVCGDPNAGGANRHEDMLYLGAERKGLNVELQWTTTADFRSSEYVIERSINGTDFEAIGQSQSDYTTVQAVIYRYEDITPLEGVNAYRIKQIFEDGSFRYSNEQYIEFEGRPSNILVFPNPANHQVNVSLNDFAGQAATLQVYNSAGILIDQVDFDALPTTAIPFKTSDYRPGMYMISVKVENRRLLTERFIVVRK